MNFRERKLIAEFTGLPLSEDPHKSRHPKKIIDIIDNVWESWKIGTEKSPEQTISENWGKLIGLKLANKCAPERLNIDKGILIIRCSSSTVKQELTFKKKELIRKISVLCSSWSITDIRIN